jgi:4-amino-4-deoxy-L-arabinose transferase-like glycosyltransferase
MEDREAALSGSTRSWISRAWPWAIALLFLLMGLPFLRKAGLHFDASAELACFYPCATPLFKARIFGHDLPVMVLQYLGTLKTWLYGPILHYLDINAFSLRLPFLLLGSASVWLFFSIVDRVAGRRAAILGALLLATDATFLIATAYDFGPIALLHCLMLAGIFLLLRFERTGSSKYLALAFLLFGLALWHKALFIWMLGGLTAAAAVVLPRRVAALVSVRRVALAATAFCVGAAPLIYYNMVTGGGTLKTTEVMSGTAPLAQKVLLVRKTMEGSVMFGWLTEDLHPESVIAPHGLLQQAAVAVSSRVGPVRRDWMLYAFLASLGLVPWLWFTPVRRAALFSVVYLAVAWGLMILLPNTGATLHHVILLWPFPHLLIALAVSQLSFRFGRAGAAAAVGAAAALVAGNLLVVNQYYADLSTRGTTALWTDAVYPLFNYLDALDKPVVVTADWGFSATLCLLSDGSLPQHDISFTLLQPTAAEESWIGSLMNSPGAVFVDYTPGNEQFPGVRERLAAIAAKAGRTKRVVAEIRDRNARPRFEIVRYQGASPERP